MQRIPFQLTYTRVTIEKTFVLDVHVSTLRSWCSIERFKKVKRERSGIRMAQKDREKKKEEKNGCVSCSEKTKQTRVLESPWHETLTEAASARGREWKTASTLLAWLDPRRVHTSVVTRARVNVATQPGIREDAYYFKVRFACASNNQSRCVTLDKSVKK